MKRLLFLLTILTGLASAQVDININQIGPFVDVARNVNWAGSGVGNVNNNFILNTAGPNSTVCYSFTNNDSSAHVLQLGTFGAVDAATIKYTTNLNAWITIPHILFNVGGGWGQSSGSLTLAANGTASIGVNSLGMARTVLSVAGASGTGTVTITAAISPSGCQGIGFPNASGIIAAGTPNIQCDSGPVSITIAAGGSAVIIAGLPGISIYLCNMQIFTATTITTNGSLVFEVAAAGGNCTSPTTVWTGYTPGTVVGSHVEWGNNIGWLFTTSGANDLCVKNNATGGSVTINTTSTRL